MTDIPAARHGVGAQCSRLMVERPEMRPRDPGDLKGFVAPVDVFSRQSEGTIIAAQCAGEGTTLRPASIDRVNGWAELLQRLGDGGAGIRAKLFIHRRCGGLIETLPMPRHDPSRPKDVLKVDSDKDGVGGYDAADPLLYLVAMKGRSICQRKLTVV